MLAAKKPVVKYNTDMDAYLGCIKSEYDAKVAASPDYARARRAAKWRRCRTRSTTRPSKEVTDVTERFNEQLRAWKAKNVAEKKPS